MYLYVCGKRGVLNEKTLCCSCERERGFICHMSIIQVILMTDWVRDIQMTDSVRDAQMTYWVRDEGSYASHKVYFMRVSTENATSPKSTQSRNPEFLVSRGTNSNWDFGSIWICSEEFEVLDLEYFGGGSFSRKTSSWECLVVCDMTHTWRCLVCDMTHSWHDSFSCKTLSCQCLVVCDMTRSTTQT